MSYPIEYLTVGEQEIVFRIRQLVGDEVEVYVDDKDIALCSNVTASGTIYQLDEPKGYPLQVNVGGTDYNTVLDPKVIGYKLLQFQSSVLTSDKHITVVYNHFRHSDTEIIDTYDTSAMTYLTAQCNLDINDLGIDLLVLATAYILLTKDLNNYIKSAVEVQDGDSRFNSVRRPEYLQLFMKEIASELKNSLGKKMSCKMLSLPVYKIE